MSKRMMHQEFNFSGLYLPAMGYVQVSMLGSTINKMNRWLEENYGSRRGCVRTYWCRIRFFMGGYRSYRKVDWVSVERLVFVCKGNICRSAYAEAVARSLGIDAISCGVNTRLNFPANDDAIQAAQVKGIDLSEHRTIPIQSLALRETDLLLVMEPWHLECIAQEYGNKYRSTLLGLWGCPVSPHIQDPYGASSVYFNHCFNYIEKTVHEVAKKVSKAN